MRTEKYEQIELIITEFDAEDVIATSEQPVLRYTLYEGNSYFD